MALASNSDERERRESRQLLVAAVGSRPKTVDVRSDLQAPSCGSGFFAVSTSGSINRLTILHAVERHEALFLTINKALEHGIMDLYW